MALIDATTPLNAANVPHKSGDDSITGQWGFTKPVGTPGGFNFTENGDVETWNAGASSPPTGWGAVVGAGASIAKDTTNVKIGLAAAALTRSVVDCYLPQRVDQIAGFPQAAIWRSRPVVLGAWVRATVASRARLLIYDGIGSTASAYHTGGSAWEFLTVKRTIDAAATQVQLRLQVDTGDTTAQFDGVVFVLGSEISDFFPSGAPIPSSGATNISGTYRSVGQNSKNNAGTPNTQFDLKADVVQLRDASNNIIVRYNPGTITCDVGVAGPAANGRDQAGAFSASSWIYFYWIWNGTILATLASATAPPTGPTLPTGYTHWAPAAAVRFNASSQLVPTYIRGAKEFYQTIQSIASSVTATTEQTFSLSTLIPPIALEATLRRQAYQNSNGRYRIVTGVDYDLGIDADGSFDTYSLEIPVIGQQVFWKQDTANGSTHYLVGFTIPNGGE